MSEQEYARGGYIEGPGETMMVRRLRDCPLGHALFSIDGAEPEHIITSDEVRANDLSKLVCQEEMPWT